MMRTIYFLLVICCMLPVGTACAGRFAVATGATPVLNSPDFARVFGGADGSTLKVDRCGQVRELEYIALPDTVFRVLGAESRGNPEVLRVETDEYEPPAGGKLYVDRHFVTIREDRPPQRHRTLPSVEEIITRLRSAAGVPYVWGGNVREGIPELLVRYYNGAVAAEQHDVLTLAGLDCSGLLYQATGGWTPRNTSQLVSYGVGVPVAGRKVDEITALLRPLDLIVWNGHVLIVLDDGMVIESRLECGYPRNGGVMIWPLRERLGEIMRNRRPADAWPAGGKVRDIFVVRRWLER